MPAFRKFVSKLRAAFSPKARRDSELAEEIEAHLAMLQVAYMRRGLSPEEAALAAKREFGGIEQTKQIYRERRGLPAIENVQQDVRLSVRSLLKNPGFAAIAIASLAIGIGANTSMFSVVRALKFRALPVPDPQQLVQVRSFSPEYRTFTDTFSFPFLQELARSKLFRSTAAMFPISVSLNANGQTSRVPAELVTAGYFQTLGIRPALGRLLGPGDVQNPGADSVCVISYSLWQSRFGGRSDVLSRSVSINGLGFRVVGVTANGFEGSVLYWPHDIQIPVSMTASFMHGFPWQSANATYLYVFARLQSGMDLTAADARLKVIGPQVGAKIRDPKNPDQTARWNQFSLVSASQGPGLMEDRTKQVSLVSAIVLLTLLIACANIASLLLARASAQERETAVQISLGAPRARIVQRYLIESLLIAGLGGIAGFIASRWLTQLFSYVLSVEFLHVTPDAWVLSFSLLACVITALLFGILPGWHASRVSARFVGLREQGTARTTRSQNLFRKALVAGQVALATVLLIGCALFLRSLQKVQGVKLGFDPHNVVVLDIDPAASGRSDAKSLEIYRAVLDRVRLLPDVESASLVFGLALSGSNGQASFPASRITTAKVPDRINLATTVSDDYFRTLRIPILRGRAFTGSDLQRAHAIIVNRAFIDYYRLGDHVLGRRFKFDKDGDDSEIVGIVGSPKIESVREQASPAMFFPIVNDFLGQLSLVARTRAPSETVFREIKKAIESVDPQTAVSGEKRFEDMVRDQYFDQRALASLCSVFSGFALLLSCMGLYGVAAYSISRRTQEIGVRLALGALRTDVARLFLSESCGIILIGLVCGIPSALGLSSLVRALLFGVEPANPLTLAVSAAALSLACLAASVLPLRHAFRVDPAETLRGE